ncbi:MAG TPA: transposase zinc-binding domain-containing protein, partial [Candidatus Methylomirabilis sp.]|nr:transposase zinc-binding domain-containing protein [Candidatus Methylomirabilis sp.]
MSGPSGHAPELTLARVLEVFLPEYLQGHAVPAHPLKVLRRLGRCRSPQLGWTVWQCQTCRRSHWRPNGCGDRHCPSCQHQHSHHWLERQRQALLPVRYFHWVFTLPAQLRPLALQNPQPLYDLLFQSASATLLQFGQQRFGAELGITAILHTWGQNLMHHPHLHC